MRNNLNKVEVIRDDYPNQKTREPNKGVSLIQFRRLVIAFIICLCFQSTISATVQSPCGCLGATVIGRTGHSYDISDLPYSLTAGTCYLIKGILVIDKDITWNGMRIQMEEESKILVEANNHLTLEDCYVTGCDDMWQGIEAETYATLWIFESFIESANIAVELNHLTFFECGDSEFIDNYVGISVGNPFDEELPHDALQISQKGQITGCKFYTDDVVPDPYSIHHYSSWPTTPSHIPFDQGFAAIYLGHSAGLNLGEEDGSVANRNKIYQIRNGIISFESDINIYGTDFYDFEGSLSRYKFDQPPVLEVNQHALYSISSNVKMVDNTITDIMIGAYCWESMSTFIDNTIDIKNTGADLILTRGIRTYFNQNLIVDNNEINDGYHGIFLQSSFGPTSIINNDFDRSVTIDHNSGIEILDARFTPYAIIEDNYMEINNGNESIGLALQQVDFIEVNDNEFYFDEDSGSAGDSNGAIVSSLVANSFFRDNDIWADANYIDEAGNHGMIFTNSVNNAFRCNSIDSMSTLFRFVMDCYNTHIVASALERGRIAFEISGPGEIGPQRHHGNEWLHHYNNGGAIITGGAAIQTAAVSRFWYDDTVTGAEPQYPLDIRPTAVQPDGVWFRFVEGIGYTCATEDPDISPDPDSLEVRILDLPQFDTLNDQMTWMMKANVFKMMLLDTSLEDNSTLDSFFDAEAVNPLGKLVSAHFDLNNRHGIDFKEKQNTQDSILILSNYIAYIDSLLSTSPNDSATWISLRLLKVDTLAQRLESWVDFLNDESSESLDVYQDVSDSLSVISTTNDMEEYYQDALLLKADFLLGDTLSTSDSSDLADIVQLCPWEGGPAISVAQGLLTFLTDSTMNVEPYDCPVPPSPVISYPDHIHQNDGARITTVYPNPAIDIVNIRSEILINSVELRDASNKLLITIQPNSTHSSIDVSSFPAGIYFITTSAVEVKETQRLILVK